MAQGAQVGGNIDWVSEGVANFLACHVPREGRWRLSRPAQIQFGSASEVGSFAWVKGNFDSVPPVAKYFAETKPNLAPGQDYYIATTMNYFLLAGADRKYRGAMIKLLQEVHMAKGNGQSFAKCFGKVDFAKMQEEWKAFVSEISIEGK